MRSAQDPRRLLESIDRKGHPAYKDMRGSYDLTDYVLSIDHIQGDPFAPPSKLSMFIPLQRVACPDGYLDVSHKRTALEDCLVRQSYQGIAKYNFKAEGSGKSGLIATNRPKPEILSRTACECSTKGITTCFKAGSPANDRTISPGELVKILLDFLSRCVKTAFCYKGRPVRKVKAVSNLAEDRYLIRCRLERLGLVLSVADGAILPRESGIFSRPTKGSVPSQSPDSLRMELDFPYHGRVTGMGPHWGVTLTVGGGYHDKSTLPKALESGVYNHVTGDRREYVTIDSIAMKPRTEDGRSVQNVDISLFINDLPSKKDTHCFSAEDANSSTSQTAAVIKGVGVGNRVFLIDGDTSAINFMIRDDLMQKIISRAQESTTPFIERARGLYEKSGISAVMVAGSSGTYFYIADTIFQMDCYEPLGTMDKIKTSCSAYGVEPITSAPSFLLPSGEHRLISNKVDFQAISGNLTAASRGNYKDRGTLGGGRGERIGVKVCGKDSLQIGKSPVGLRFVEQFTDAEQTSTLAQTLCYYAEYQLLEQYAVRDTISVLLKEIQRGRPVAVGDNSYTVRGLFMPRIQEIYAYINYYRN